MKSVVIVVRRRNAVLLLFSLATAMLLAGGLALLGVAEPAKAVPSAEEGKILFQDSSSALSTMNPDGSGRSSFSPSFAGSYPADGWTADGTKFVIVDWDNNIVISSADGENRTPIPRPNNLGLIRDPTLSPDGTKVAFAVDTSPDFCDPETGVCGIVAASDIYTMNVDGTGQSRLTSGVDAAWSPKGTRLIFGALPDNNQLYWDLFTINVDGSNRTNLTNTPNESEGNPNWQPVFASPDTTAPKVDSVSPADATKVSRTTKVTANFSEAVQAATLTSNTVQLFSGKSTRPVKATLSKTSTSVTLTPSSKLDAMTRYTAQIKGGATGVKDLAGNQLASDYSWSFTTGSM
jgi:Tol biopolymer transport system component